MRIFGPKSDGDDAATQSDLSGGGSAPAMPTGSVIMWPSTTPPSGWLMCDGTAKSRSTYSDLNALMAADSYQYGSGNGSTTFNMPNFVSSMPYGSVLPPISLFLGTTGGQSAVVLTTDQIPAHTHTFEGFRGSGGSSGSGNRMSSLNNPGGGNHSANTSSVGSGRAHENMPPFLTINFIIKT